MPTKTSRIQLIPHLTTDELTDAARECSDANVRTRLEAIRLVSKGWSNVAVGDALGYKRGWVRTLVKRFNESGIEGLQDRRADNGRDLKLDAASLEILKASLAGPSPDGGLWNGSKVRRFIAARVGEPVGKRIGWKYLVRLDFSLQRPQTRHASADLEKQDAFKKRSAPSSQPFKRLSPKLASKSGRKTKHG